MHDRPQTTQIRVIEEEERQGMALYVMECSDQTQSLKFDQSFVGAEEHFEISRAQGSRPWLEDCERNCSGGLEPFVDSIEAINTRRWILEDQLANARRYRIPYR